MLHLLPLDGPTTPQFELGSVDGPADQVARNLQGSEIIKTISAGWASKEDLSFLLPLLAATHDAAVQADEGANEETDEAQESGIRSKLGITDPQRAQYDAALTAIATPRANARQLPVAIKYFAQQCQAAQRDASAAGVQDFIEVSQQVSALVLKAIERGFHKIGINPQWPAAPIQAPPTREPAISAESAQRRGEVLALHMELHAELYRVLRFERVRAASDRIQARLSLETEDEPPIALYPGVGEIMFTEDDQARDIAFTVERYPCTAEVLDPRVVRIPPGKSNNRHKHAHETLFYFISGTGSILVGETWTPVKAGDAVFSPRWAIHQTRNTGDEELVLLAITDYYLTSQVYVGAYDKI
ncbi:Uncharacterized conserved protein%2C contains double-stranded beta-helix domain [Bordetella ansorpii]|uniref:Uncharacterized conserved protein, contains double-stranded beta-helix domain n=1 Tax=Bordetella ansorpii TaxID=288768 RepID=A0A157SEN1_9BORD|nr:cupin domain-containing protein [Bordetella ansorpii]SAI68912.1 Uncharacterized conserved protein%2C contains double-stranded beta-helix domain [Bordetella ansorpii]